MCSTKLSWLSIFGDNIKSHLVQQKYYSFVIADKKHWTLNTQYWDCEHWILNIVNCSPFRKIISTYVFRFRFHFVFVLFHLGHHLLNSIVSVLDRKFGCNLALSLTIDHWQPPIKPKTDSSVISIDVGKWASKVYIAALFFLNFHLFFYAIRSSFFGSTRGNQFGMLCSPILFVAGKCLIYVFVSQKCYHCQCVSKGITTTK